MKSSCIDYSATGMFSPAVISYLNDDTDLRQFYNDRPNIEGFKKLISKRPQPASRHILVNVLKEQYQNYDTTSPAVKNIELLANKNSYTITTGHQLNIFTGPLYFIFKIATAIKLASDLKVEFPDSDFIPVYWMATEDHDFAEINHTIIGDKKIEWDQPIKGPTGRLDPKSISKALKEYQGILGISENASRLSAMVENAYRQPSLAAATRYLVHELFGEYGLVVIDADNAKLKQLFAPFIAQDILEQNSFREINEASEALTRARFSTQVHAREINFFYMEDGLRERITLENGHYYVLNTDLKFSKEELETEIKTHPEKFSPNVVLRPLYQEVILPNLAYIGGGAEIVYWLQLKKNFDFYQVSFPILILRNSGLLADESQNTRLQKLGLTFNDLFKETEKLKKDWVMDHTERELSLTAEWQELQSTFEKMKQRASSIDPTLKASTEAVAARLHKALLNLEKKLIRAEKRNFSTALSQIEKIKADLFPGGGLQERVENFGLFYVKHGNDLIAELIRNFQPLDFKFTILY